MLKEKGLIGLMVNLAVIVYFTASNDAAKRRITLFFIIINKVVPRRPIVERGERAFNVETG